MQATIERKVSSTYIQWYEKMVIGIKKVHFTLLCYASQLNNWAHQRKMGPNCAAGLVLVLSVDTVSYNLTWQHTTTSKLYMNSALAMGLGGPSGSKEKCDLQSRLTPPRPHIPCPSRPASSFPPCYTAMITWLWQSKQLQRKVWLIVPADCWTDPGIPSKHLSSMTLQDCS